MAYWHSSQLNGVETVTKVIFIRQSFKVSGNNIFKKKKKKKRQLHVPRQKNVNLTDSVLRLSQLLMQRAEIIK